jgi:hypothetical protein
VSCIYGMGNPAEYRGQLLELHTGVDYDQRSILRRLVDLQFDRNDMTLGRGSSGSAVTPSRSIPRTRSPSCASRCSATPSTDYDDRHADGRTAERALRDHDLPGDPLRRGCGADGARGARHRGRAAGAARVLREGGQAARGASVCGCGRSTTSR